MTAYLLGFAPFAALVAALALLPYRRKEASADWKQVVAWLVFGLSVLAALLVFTVLGDNFNALGWGEKLGQRGDAIGGHLAGGFGVVSAFLMFGAFLLQSHEIGLTREEMKKAREESEGQTKAQRETAQSQRDLACAEQLSYLGEWATRLHNLADAALSDQAGPTDASDLRLACLEVEWRAPHNQRLDSTCREIAKLSWSAERMARQTIGQNLETFSAHSHLESLDKLIEIARASLEAGTWHRDEDLKNIRACLRNAEENREIPDSGAYADYLAAGRALCLFLVRGELARAAREISTPRSKQD